MPHLLYHATHLDPYESADKVAVTVSLAINVLAAVLALAPDRPVAARHATHDGPGG